MKYSKQREIIYKWVVNNPIHPTADEVYSNLKAVHPNLSLGTVYRNLNLLSENDKLLKIKTPNGSDKFDGRLDTHHHIVCTKCGDVYDVELPEISDIHEKIQNSTDFTLEKINIVLYGTCKNCSE